MSDRPVRVLFLGDSLTAGSGLRPDQAYPALVGEIARAEGFALDIVNAGVGGDTSAGGLARLGWYVQPRVDVLVLALGANDMLRGVDPSETERNLKAIIDEIRRENPDVRILLAGMKALPNMGAEFGATFEAVYPRVAEAAQVAFMPFLLQGVAGRPLLNLEDGMHPNEEGHKIMAGHVWKHLRSLVAEPLR